MPNLIAVGRLRVGPESELFARYAARLRPALTLTEIAEARGSAAETRRREGASLLSALPPRAFAIALDLGGQAPDSAGLAALLDRWLALGLPVCFLIGGAEGLDRAVLDRADFALSLGKLTWPHMLARVLLAEQLYRAQTINAGHPYHRAIRP
ncbi:MAG: 23S rRNA (pseudouridine(1915)-N(3))-methyltransferase RlmH [Acetobacteraceae bacterium]